MTAPPSSPPSGRYRFFHAGGMAAVDRRVACAPGVRCVRWHASVRLPGEDVVQAGPAFDTLDEAMAWGLSRLHIAPAC